MKTSLRPEFLIEGYTVDCVRSTVAYVLAGFNSRSDICNLALKRDLVLGAITYSMGFLIRD